MLTIAVANCQSRLKHRFAAQIRFVAQSIFQASFDPFPLSPWSYTRGFMAVSDPVISVFSFTDQLCFLFLPLCAQWTTHA
jgi:hypothetical protein